MNIVTTLGAKGTKIDGLWADKSGVTDMYVSQGARQAWSYKRETAWDGEYFGGVAFKYQEPVNDVALAAKKANEYMDVVTTSGVATGSAPDLDKIRWMSTEANRLAIASGLTPENIGEFVEWASDFLVATGISKNFHELDPDKAKAFAAIVHGQL
jgi:predicted TIM-barrel enzyme